MHQAHSEMQKPSCRGAGWVLWGNREAGIDSGSPQLLQAGEQLGLGSPVGRERCPELQMCVTHLSQHVAAGVEHHPDKGCGRAPHRRHPGARPPPGTQTLRASLGVPIPR